MQSEAKAKALEQFTDYFVKNYPGPDTIIYDPKWHAPKIFAAAYSAITAALSEKQAVEVVAYPISMVGDVLVDRYGVPVPTTEAPHSEGEDSAEVIATLEFVALWAWREDPPAAARNLSDGERLSAIKYHPTIKALAATHSGSATNSSGGAE